MRRLQITVSGRWYVALTIALGVVAMVSGNNVLYLIESLLLAGLILSGILSERTIAAVEARWLRGRAIAGETLPDRLHVSNGRRFQIFCVEIGEWRGGKLHPLAYLPKLAPGAAVTIPCKAIAGARGTHRWDGLAVATSFPFGFARKILILRDPGERLIWPGRAPGLATVREDRSGRQGQRSGGELSDGEIRTYDPSDDSRMIVWTLSAKGQGPLVRVRRREQETPRIRLDLRAEAGEEFERDVLAAARHFHESRGGDEGFESILILTDHGGSRKIRGRIAVLDELARARALGRGGG